MNPLYPNQLVVDMSIAGINHSVTPVGSDTATGSGQLVGRPLPSDW
jgi:hypothetical protein